MVFPQSCLPILSFGILVTFHSIKPASMGNNLPNVLNFGKWHGQTVLIVSTGVGTALFYFLWELFTQALIQYSWIYSVEWRVS